MLPLLLALLLETASGTQPATSPAAFVVASDNGGTHRTLQAAIDASAQLADGKSCTISILPGVYREWIHIPRRKGRLRLIGIDPQETIITGNLTAHTLGADGQPIGTARTPTVRIDADDFSCENVTFENSAAPHAGQAIAVQIDGDRVNFKNCQFLGYQDTIYGDRGRHYFDGCTIVGAIDFIFGGATEFYENCTIRCIGDGYVVAASTPANQPYGMIFEHCRITGASSAQTFLGRPWRSFAATAFLHCYMDASVRPAGWDPWDEQNEKTARYAEYQNRGDGAVSVNRVAWAKQLSDAEAAAFAKARVLNGWLP